MPKLYAYNECEHSVLYEPLEYYSCNNLLVDSSFSFLCLWVHYLSQINLIMNLLLLLSDDEMAAGGMMLMNGTDNLATCEAETNENGGEKVPLQQCVSMMERTDPMMSST